VSATVDRLKRSLAGDLARAAWLSAPVRKVRHVASREPRNAELKDLHSGRRCFIFGNGPSILRHDLAALDGVKIALNNFFYHPQFHEIGVDYTCAHDPAFLEPDRRRRWYELHEEKQTQATVKLFNMQMRRVDRRLRLFRNHTVFYLYAGSETLAPMWERENFPIDLTRPLATYGIVLTDIAIPAALYLGCKEIILLGFDSQPIRSFEDYLNFDFYGKDPLTSMERYRDAYLSYFVDPYHFSVRRKGVWEGSVPTLLRTVATHGATLVNATGVGHAFHGIPRVSPEEAGVHALTEPIVMPRTKPPYDLPPPADIAAAAETSASAGGESSSTSAA
jgi:hypothetical protein